MANRTSPFTAPQKLKLEEPIYSESHAVGSILKIKLTHFMAFDKITVCPGPGTNLILGTNGSGKSSIIAAIGICFGASPQMINNSQKLANFIRTGYESAKIRIVLKAEPLITILCILDRSSTKPTWKFRQKKQTFKEISLADLQRIMDELKIHVDNLCMYLPQERVKEFAALKPKELLTATLDIISPELADQKLKIQKSMDDVIKKREQLAVLEEDYNRNKSLVEQKSNDVSRLDKREQTEQSIAEIEFRIRMIDGESTAVEYEQLKAKLRSERDEITALDATLAEYQNKTQMAKENLDLAIEYRAAAEKEFRNIQSKIYEYMKYNTQMTQKKSKAKSNLNEAQKSLAQKSTAIEKAEKNIEQMEKEILPEDERAKIFEKSRELKEKIHAYKTSQAEKKPLLDDFVASIKRRKAKINDLQQQLSKARNQKNQIIDRIIERYDRKDIKTLCDYISQHKTHFKGQVFGPAIAEINFPDQLYAKYFFFSVDQNFQLAFICEDSDDQNDIIGFCKQYKLTRITLVRCVEDRRPRFDNKQDVLNMGFSRFVTDTFEAPDLVKKFFNVMSYVDRVPIAEDNIRVDNMDLFKLGIRRFFIHGYSYNIFGSRFNVNSISAVVKPVKPSSFWQSLKSSSNSNGQHLKEKIEKSEAKIKELEAGKRDIERQINDLNNESAAIQSELTDISLKLSADRNNKEKLKKTKDSIKRLRDELEDLMEKPRMYKNKLKDLNKEMADQLFKYFELLVQLKQQLIHLDKKTREVSILEKIMYDCNTRLTTIKLEHANKFNTLTINVQKYRELKAIVKELRKEKKTNFTQEQREKINNLPSDLNQLRAMMNESIARLGAISGIRPEIRKEYEDALHKQNILGQEKEALAKKIDSETIKNLEMRQAWQRDATNILKPLGAAFKKMMSECGFNGNVRLSCEKDKTDMSFQIDLLVAFRQNVEMTVLSSTRQSGGEKSVATLLYLLALQSCTPFPFRVIDEINQGMDEENEVATFTHAMNCAMGQGNETQYFLVSPKLHENLHIPEAVTVLLVLSGPWIQEDLDKPVLLRKYSQ